MKEDQTHLELEMSDVDQSVLQIIQQELLKDDKVEFAAMNRPHPLLKTYKMSIITKEGNPRVIFKSACGRALEKSKVLEEEVIKALGTKKE
ncbi:MAG: RpoL/Rpb11 RNA polymerase subunit family protein [Candidatus Micrarchaeaceae archaeon]